MTNSFEATDAPALILLGELNSDPASMIPDRSSSLPDGSASASAAIYESLWQISEAGAVANTDGGNEPFSSIIDTHSGVGFWQDADPLINQAVIDQAWATARDTLADFWQTSDRSAALTFAFGEGRAADTADVVQQLIDGQILPQIAVLPEARLQAQGAYAAEESIIFLSRELFSDSAALNRVLIEEIGHAIDAKSESELGDALGDEGALFAAEVFGKELSANEVQKLRDEDDSAQLRFNGQVLAVERADLGPGTFTVDATGQVTVEFLVDSGAYQGQLAVFSLDGMEGLTPGSTAFIQEAARRALSNSPEGYVVINDIAEGASLNGELEEANRNAGNPAGARAIAFAPNSHIAVMLVPNGTVQTVFDNPAAAGALRPLFSLASANPDGRVHIGEIRPGVYALEDVRFDDDADADFNDVIFQLQGATAQIEAVTNLIGSRQAWVDTPLGRQLFMVSDGDLTMMMAANNPIFPPVNAANLQVAFPASGTPKFNAGSTEAAIAASGAARITIGSQTIYIGTNQVATNNQNPIVASFDSVNPANNWIRTDYEVTGADGRGVGIAWDGNSLYGVFTVDGTQGTPNQDFRRAANDAEQAWLRSYGQGGGPTVSVLARIDPTNGELVDAAYLSAVLNSGNSNTLRIQNIAVN
ncbi:MAG: DUF4114 domain-containing protein, partial [Cyanobacteria bacterium P01_C01_bin.120]